MNNVISTRVTIYRNVKDFKFDSKLTLENKQQIIQMLEKALEGKMNLISLNQDGNLFKQLNENDLVLGNSQNLFIAKNNTAINLFNGEHLSIVSSCIGFNRSVISNAVEVSNNLANKIPFAYHDDYGYLMSDLNKIGSGIRLETNIMLSAITKINKIDQVKHNVAKLGYSLQETKFPAIYTLSTTCNLGIGENKLCEDFENTLLKLQELEIESVKMIDVENHDEMLDKVARSLAILNSAVLLTYDELYNIVVNLRMGLNLGLVNIKYEILNKLHYLVSCKRDDIITPSELKDLAKKSKEMLKGE